MATDLTVKIFNQFYDLDLVVSAYDYELVYSFFKGMYTTDKIAKSFTETLFRIANQTQISVLELLQTFQTSEKLKINLTMAYYLNSISTNKTVLYGVLNPVAPNEPVARNIVQ